MAAEPSSVETRLQEVIAVYLQEHQSGQAPDRTEFLAAHPELADDLRAFFADHDKMTQAAAPVRASLGEDPAQVSPTTETFPQSFGDYALLEEIGRGGMGVVYKARQISLNRFVALKRIRAGQLASPEEVARFRREAEAAAGLDHPHIVPILGVGELAGQHYFTMKLIEGGNLGSQLSQHRNAVAGIGLMIKISRAVNHAHERGVLHRDLKPGNILIDAAGEPHISDFGLAQPLEKEGKLTQSGAIVGTAEYMAPEQARGEKGLTTAADVYGLGAILYVLLTGKPPFQGDYNWDTLKKVVEDEPISPRSLNRTVDRDLDTICLKCLQKEPTRRYRTAEALAEDLERWQQGRPIQARPARVAERLWKWARRRPAAAALLVVTFTAVFGLIAGGLYFTRIVGDANGELTRVNDELRTVNNNLNTALDESKDMQVKLDENVKVLANEKARANAMLQTARRDLFTMQLLRVGAIYQRDPLQALQLLHDYRVCPIDQRDIAWRYYQRACTFEPQHFKTVQLAMPPVLPFEGRVITDRNGRAVFLEQWRDPDAKPGEMSYRVVNLPDGATLYSGKALFRSAKALSPDGKLAVVSLTGDDDEAGPVKLELLDTTTGKSQAFPFPLPDNRCETIVFSADSNRLALWGGPPLKKEDKDGVWVFDLKSNEEVGFIPCLFGTGMLSPDGTLLAGLGDEGPMIRVWEVATGKERTQVPTAIRNRVVPILGEIVTDKYIRDHLAMAFSPDGRFLATTSPPMSLNKTTINPSSDFQSCVLLWDLEKKRQAAFFGELSPAGDGDPWMFITSLHFTPDGRWLIGGTNESQVMVWDTQSDLVQGPMLTGGPKSGLRWATINDNNHLVALTFDNQLQTWDLNTRTILTDAGADRNKWGAPTNMVIEPGNKLAMVLRYAGPFPCEVVSFPGGRSLLKLPYEAIYATSPDGLTLAAFGYNEDAIERRQPVKKGVIDLWDLKTGKLRQTLNSPGNVVSFSFPSNGTLHVVKADIKEESWHGLVSNHERRARSVEIWDTAKGELKSTLALDQAKPHPDLKDLFPERSRTWIEWQRLDLEGKTVLSPDRQTEVSAGKHGELYFHDAATKQQRATLQGHPTQVSEAYFTSDGQTLITRCKTHTIFWDLGQPREHARWTAQAQGVGPDGKSLVLCNNREFHLVDLSTGRTSAFPEDHFLRQILEPWRHEPFGWSYSSDGTLVFGWRRTFSRDSWALVHDVATRKELAGGVGTGAFHPRKNLFAISHLAGNRPPGDPVTTMPWDKARVKQVASSSGQVTLWEKRDHFKDEDRNVAGFTMDGQTLLLAIPHYPRRGLGKDEPAVRVEWWDVKSGELRRKKEMKAWKDGNPLVFHPDGNTLVLVAMEDGKKKRDYEPLENQVTLLDLAHDRQRILPVAHSLSITHGAFNDNGTLLAAGDAGGTVAVWNVATGQLLARFKPARPPQRWQPCGVSSLSFLSNDQLLAVERGEKTLVRLWHLAGIAGLPAAGAWPKGI